jgi:hypothetical protein
LLFVDIHTKKKSNATVKCYFPIFIPVTHIIISIKLEASLEEAVGMIELKYQSQLTPLQFSGRIPIPVALKIPNVWHNCF